MRMKVLIGFVFVVTSACYVDRAGDAASEGGLTGDGETHYCHPDLELRKYIKGADGQVGSTDIVAKVDVKIVTSLDDTASVQLVAVTDKGEQMCVRYSKIPIDPDHGTGTILEGYADGGFHLDIGKDAGFLGQPTQVEWAKANRQGSKYGADFLSVGVGKGLYKHAPGESYYHNKTFANCPSASQEAGSGGEPANCVEYEYTSETVDGTTLTQWKVVE